MQRRIEDVILTNLVLDENYTRKVIPFLKEEYFHASLDKTLFKEIAAFVADYNNPPTKESLIIQLNNRSGISTEDFKQSVSFVERIDRDYEKPNEDWIIESTEQFCKDKAVLNAIMHSISIIDGDDKNHTKDAIPSILSDALAVSFDNNVGHDYFNNTEERYDFYTRDESRIPFDIDILNKITNGGLPSKSLTIFLGATGTGKTNIQCHLATSYLRQGKNVLYITLEMAEERIAERIDANMLNVNIDKIKELGKETFSNRVTKLSAKTNGRLIIKEYPPVSAHAGHFKALIDELNLKKNFRPDVILIDYLGICASSRYKNGANVNSYAYIKSVAEELRGLAVFYDLPVITSVQTNRSGSTNSDLGLEDSADSFGIAMTADLFIGLITNEELAEMSQIMMKVLKNRFNDVNYYRKFIVGIDRAKMRLYNLEESAQSDMGHIPEPSIDPSMFGGKQNKKDFSGFTI